MQSLGNISGLRCEHLVNPLGLTIANPRLSWLVEDAPESSWQQAYQIQVASHPDRLRSGQPDLWDSGKVSSRQSVFIPYGGQTLGSRQRVFWAVRTWNENDRPLPWSKIAYWEMGLLEPGDWRGKWIGRSNPTSELSPPCPFLRKGFFIDQPVRRGRLYISARGVFEAWLNNDRVGEDYLTPGWTEYPKRLEYSVYNITKWLKEGENALGVILGDGWYCGTLLFQNQRAHYGDEASLLAQMVLDYEDGSCEVIATDDTWKLAEGPLVRSDLYHGEIYDAQKELADWTSPGYEDSDWHTVEVLQAYGGKLVGKTAPPVRVIEELAPKAIVEQSPGIRILDLGQNMVGIYRLRIAGATRGQQIQLRFGEMLQEDGSLYTANLRKAKATDTYVCRGGGEEVYLPRFTFHGFRYVEISGYPGTLNADAFAGLVLHTDMEPTGKFECSDPLVNQLQSNIVWGQKGNFLDIPTDCPQRDERLGWTGDAQVFLSTACFNFNVAGFFSRWLEDMSLAQFEDGAITDVVPAVMATSRLANAADLEVCRSRQGNAAWADAAVICPWVLYQRYGDTGILESSWSMMCGWIEYQRATSKDLIRPETSYGDWLAVDAEAPGEAPTPSDLIGTAYFAHTTGLMAGIAGLLGKTREAEQYGELHNAVLAAFNRKYVDETGRIAGDTQTAYLLSLAFDLLPKVQEEYAVNRLVELIEQADDHLSTGFVGTPLLCPVLSRYGRTDVAYRLLMRKSYPGWLYTVLNGATTMWERWNSWTEEEGFGAVGMNSFNHYAYGAIGQWLYATVGGIDVHPDCPGFEKILIQPQPGGGLTYAKAELKTPYGWVKSYWRIENAVFYLDVTVPANSSALVTLPSGNFYEALVNAESLEETHHVIYLSIQEKSVGFTLRSGTFKISIPLGETGLT